MLMCKINGYTTELMDTKCSEKPFLRTLSRVWFIETLSSRSILGPLTRSRVLKSDKHCWCEDMKKELFEQITDKLPRRSARHREYGKLFYCYLRIHRLTSIMNFQKNITPGLGSERASSKSWVGRSFCQAISVIKYHLNTRAVFKWLIHNTELILHHSSRMATKTIILCLPGPESSVDQLSMRHCLLIIRDHISFLS